MIISHKFKYIFVGLPFSASSAISKELLENYEGEPILSKHSNIPLLLKEYPEIKIADYYVFLVVREPSEIVFSKFNKLISNAYNVYTDDSYLIENGGFVSKSDREEYEFIKSNSINFSQFLKKRYNLIPYDNALSININYINGFLKFENLKDDFNNCLKEIGIEPKRDLPLVNKTNKVLDQINISKKDLSYFYSFKYANKKVFNTSFDLLKSFQYLRFKLISKIKYNKWYKFDLFYYRNRKNKSMVS
jgi:hypothetical protein